MIRELVAAVLARLRSDPQLADVVFLGDVTGRPDRYVVVYTDQGHRTRDRIGGPSTAVNMTVTVHSCGSTVDQAQWVADRVFGLLLDWVPDLGGRTSWPTSHEVSQPAQKDSDVSPPVFYTVDVFDVVSTV